MKCKWRLRDVPGLKSVCKAWSTENAAWVHSLSPIPLDRSASWSAAMLRSGTSSVLWTKQESQLQSTISKPTHFQKWPVVFVKCWEIVSCGNTTKEVSFEWTHHGILSTDSKFRTRYQTNSTTSTTKEVSFKWSHHRISSTSSKVRTTLPNPSCSLAVKVLPWPRGFSEKFSRKSSWTRV